MSRSLRRGALAATAIAFSLASLSACAAGNNAQTMEIKPDNAATTVGDIKIQNAMVITQPGQESAGPAAVAATIFNSGDKPQTLNAVSVDGAEGKAKLTRGKEDKDSKPKGPLTIPAGGSIVIGGKDNASAVLSGNLDEVKEGNAQPVTFSFSRTGDVKMEAFVVPAESYFSKWGPTEVPQAPGGKPSKPAKSGEPGQPGESGKPGESASGAATDPSGAPSGDAAGHAADGAETDPSGSASHDAGTGTGTGTGAEH
ncbi:copper chaperone PCu(A)C [Streptomyces sp. NPDC029674]|uniref:copper chaperone PCu(A)C n=1 Tax=Streptomyces sp. NPDC029674 TaxID=3365297 RepID=UPI00384E33B9